MKRRKFLLNNCLFLTVLLFNHSCCAQQKEKLYGKYIVDAYYTASIELFEKGEYFFKYPADSYYEKDFYENKGNWKKKNDTLILNSYLQPNNDSVVKYDEQYTNQISKDSVVFKIHILSSQTGLEYSEVPVGVGFSLYLSGIGKIIINNQVKSLKVKWASDLRKYFYLEDLEGILKPITILNVNSNHFELFYKENSTKKVRDKECFINEIVIVKGENLIFRDSTIFTKVK